MTPTPQHPNTVTGMPFRSIDHATRMIVDSLDGIPQGMTHFQVDEWTHKPHYVAPGVTGGTITIAYRLDTAPIAGPRGRQGDTGPMGMTGEKGDPGSGGGCDCDYFHGGTCR